MKTVVCIKVIKGEINPFDEAALELALRLSDDVTVVSMGIKASEEALLPLMRLGAKIILISDSRYAGSDTLATSYILSEAIKKIGFDLVICGRQSTDGDTAQVGPMLSQQLGVSAITNVISAECDGNKITAQTRIGNEAAGLPALITAERVNYLRFPSIFSQSGKVCVWSDDDLKCDLSRCGLDGSPTRVLKTFENKAGKRKCRFISYDEMLSVIETARKCEAAAEKSEVSPVKLSNVWAVGEKAAEIGRGISENVIVIPEEEPHRIVERARREEPEVILWNADLWGRKNAAIAAAALNTGLCADCTALETDGKQLFMIRPAQGGNITAKIKCLTMPQMATVRTVSDLGDVIVSGGRGVVGDPERLWSFADKIGALRGASRGLVDSGKAPYEYQIGLTGKSVSPKVYVAVGISGAVHHTCAIERAQTVIAINPDKNARIFEYADYGVLQEF